MKVPTSLRDLFEGAESLVYIEDLSGKRGLLQTVNPLAKLIVIIFMIVASLCINSLEFLILICFIPLFLAIASQIPLKNYLSRTTLIPLFAMVISLPWIFLTSGQPLYLANLGALNITITLEGLTRFLIFTIRVWFCVASLTLLVLSTGFDKLLKILYSLRIPSLIVHLFSLTYRYFFVSIDEAQSILLAKEARTYNNKHTINLQALKNLGSIIAALFIRTYERSERVYLAMKSRGFELENSNKTSTPKFHLHDLLFVTLIITAFTILAFL